MTPTSSEWTTGQRLQRVPRVEALLERMTLEEKIGQMAQHAYGHGEMQDVEQRIQRGLMGSLLNVRDLEERNRLQHLAVERSRLGIPLIFGRDVIHGYKTIFPIPLGQAASFNPALAETSCEVAAREASEHGIDWTFAPMIDIARDPRWAHSWFIVSGL